MQRRFRRRDRMNSIKLPSSTLKRAIFKFNDRENRGVCLLLSSFHVEWHMTPNYLRAIAQTATKSCAFVYQMNTCSEWMMPHVTCIQHSNRRHTHRQPRLNQIFVASDETTRMNGSPEIRCWAFVRTASSFCASHSFDSATECALCERLINGKPFRWASPCN